MPANASVTKSSRTERIRHPEAESFDLATVMRALGDPVRIEMVRDGRRRRRGPSAPSSTNASACPRSTGSYHLRQLREAGVTRARAVGTNRIVSLRREDLESRFPGLVDLVLRADA